MNSKEYKGQKIIAQSLARMVPPNDDYPDCMCELVLTERSFYVLEDNYDHTYTEHFKIPVSRIDNMRILGSSSDGDKGDTFFLRRDVFHVLLTIWGLFAGIFVYFADDTKNKLRGSYIRLDYSDEWAVKKELFFKELDRSAKKVVNCLDQIKKI